MPRAWQNGEQFTLLQVGVELNLVHGRPDAGLPQERMEGGNAEVAHPDVAAEALLHSGFHRGPGGREGQFLKRDQIIGCLRQPHPWPQGHGPVDQIEVEVIQPQIGQGLLQGRLHILGGMGAVPQLGGDPELLPPHQALAECNVERFTDLGFIAVDGGRVDVAIAEPQGGQHRRRPPPPAVHSRCPGRASAARLHRRRGGSASVSTQRQGGMD